MAMADKCHLLIPFKEWGKQLADALEGVEGADISKLRISADQEFENYKAIERRINDPDCVGGSCGCFALEWNASQLDPDLGDGGDPNLLELVAEGGTTRYLVWDDTPLLVGGDASSVTGGGTTNLTGFPAGAYSVTGFHWIFDQSGSDTVQISCSGLPYNLDLLGVFPAGFPAGNAHHSFAGTFYQADPWSINVPSFTMRGPLLAGSYTRAMVFTVTVLQVTRFCGCTSADLAYLE